MNNPVDFGKTASDYRRYRQGFPDAFFDRMFSERWVSKGDELLDLGTGTGTLARGFASRGVKVTGLDIAAPLLDQARALSVEEGLDIHYQWGRAEETGLNSHTFDVVVAGQCWHWFNGPVVASEVKRLLRPGGRVVICHFDWIPLRGNVVSATEALILQFNPRWTLFGGTGIYPRWLTDLGEAGFGGLSTGSFDVGVNYTSEAWRGRIRASAGISASLPPEEVAHFDEAHLHMLAEKFPEPELVIPHRVWWVTGQVG